MISAPTRTPEIIAVTSGKGGTGKTLVSACLGYALTRAGHRVLMIDADTATDGLSLFLLGPQGARQQRTFELENTFAAVLSGGSSTEPLNIAPRQIHRSASTDHGVTYDALISGRGLYGDVPPPDPVDRAFFRERVAQLFAEVEALDRFDYVIVDTRGGFSFETTDVCALASSFILVVEPDYTSFYQARNLVREVSTVAQDLGKRPLFRAIFVNKALEIMAGDSAQLDLQKMEVSFRNELVREFEGAGIRFEDTYPLPLDPEVLRAYKTQDIPLRHAPAFRFSFAILSAFADILSVVTSPWTANQVTDWNHLVDSVGETIAQQNATTRKRAEDEQARLRELATMRADVTRMGAELARAQEDLTEAKARYDREVSRTEVILQTLAPPRPVATGSVVGANRNTLFVGLVALAALVIVVVLMTRPAPVPVPTSVATAVPTAVIVPTPSAVVAAAAAAPTSVVIATVAPVATPRPATPTAPPNTAVPTPQPWRQIGVFTGHEGSIHTAAFSPDGLTVLTASHDANARLWDVTSGQGTDLPVSNGSVIWSAQFSPTGDRIALAFDNGNALLTSRVASSLAIGANRLFASARMNGAPTGGDIELPHGGKVFSAAFSPDGRRVVTASAVGARVWDAETGAPGLMLLENQGTVFNARFSPDGKLIATAGEDGTTRVWDAATGQVVAVTRGHTGPVVGLAFSADGTRLATAGHDGRVLVSDSATLAQIASWRGHGEGMVWSVGFSPTTPAGTRLVTTGDDARTVVWDWDGTGYRQSAELRGHTDAVHDAQFSPDGLSIVTGSQDHTAALWTIAATGAQHFIPLPTPTPTPALKIGK